MRCHEAKNLAGPYLDSELDAKTSYEIEQHLESCPDCARVFNTERELDTRMFAALRRGEKTAAMWQRLETQMSSRSFWTRVKPLSMPLCAAAAVAAVILLILLWLNLRSVDLAVAVEKDHRAYVEGNLSAQFAGPLPDAIAQTLSGRLDARAFSTFPSATAFRIEGARVCHLSGVPVAWVLGRYEGIPVSVIVLNRSELAHFPRAKRRLDSGEPVLCTRTRLFQFAARVVGDQVVCAVADTSKAQLEELVKSVRGPG